MFSLLISIDDSDSQVPLSTPSLPCLPEIFDKFLHDFNTAGSDFDGYENCFLLTFFLGFKEFLSEDHIFLFDSYIHILRIVQQYSMPSLSKNAVPAIVRNNPLPVYPHLASRIPGINRYY